MIYVVKHKEYHDVAYPENYDILLVGDLYNDPTKENINDLNPILNELTGLYYMWKNVSDDVVGLNHYRRVFVDQTNAPISFAEISGKLDSADIVLQKEVTMPNSIHYQLNIEMTPENPQLYYYQELAYKIEPGLKDYFNKSRRFSPCNMFVCKKELMDKYCEWLFAIALPMANEFKEKHFRTTQQPRMLAFFTERFLTYWVRKNDLKVCYNNHRMV